ncbi:unnamed protein product [Meganyctiphanes norvegica]|uniref:Major facilitator superfamily (MFS) profile domain-containing protein n=1 Tax=Meganyctiphanes norvegica TaxID=48144 RepID=A0AAV2RTL2_MEGNR
MSEDINFKSIQYSQLSVSEPKILSQDTDSPHQEYKHSASEGSDSISSEMNQIMEDAENKCNSRGNDSEEAHYSDKLTCEIEDVSPHSLFLSHNQPKELITPENLLSNDLKNNAHLHFPQSTSNLEIDMSSVEKDLSFTPKQNNIANNDQAVDSQKIMKQEEDKLISNLPEDRSPNVQTKPVYGTTTWPTAKDGGYSWVIVGAVFIINVIAAGYIKAFGVLLLAVHDYFPDASNFSLGLVMSLLHGCRGLTAPLMGAISVMIGARNCVTLGVLLMCTGLLLAVLCTNVYQLAFTIGAMAGAGICMSETPGVIVVNQYFESLRSTANGLRTAGNPLGGMLFPLFYVPFLQNFGLKGTYIMLSGVALQMCVMGFLLRSFHVHKKCILKQHLKQLKGDYTINYLEDNMVTENSVRKKNKKKPLDFTLLKNPVFLFYIAMNLGLTFVLPNSIYYSALYAKEIGLGPWEISILLSYYSGLDCVCRLLCGYLTDLKIYKKRHGFLAGLFLASIGLFLVPLTWNMWSLMAALSINALGFAYYYVLVVVLLADQFGEDLVASTWGFFRMSQGVGFFITPPLLGLLADASGSLTLPFLWMGLMMLLPMIFFALQPVVGKLSGIKVVIS